MPWLDSVRQRLEGPAAKRRRLVFDLGLAERTGLMLVSSRGEAALQSNPTDSRGLNHGSSSSSSRRTHGRTDITTRDLPEGTVGVVSSSNMRSNGVPRRAATDLPIHMSNPRAISRR